MDVKYDCSKLLIDFSTCPKGIRLVNHFAELSAYDEFSMQQDENTIKIAILTADQDSPFLKLRGDRELMIRAIFEFLDIGTKNQIGQSFLNKVINYKHEGVAQCWGAYLQLQYSIDFTDWSITKQTYDMLISESMRLKEKDESVTDYANWRVKVRDQIRKLGIDLKSAEALVFKDSKMARPVAIEQAKKIKNYPEKYAEKKFA